MKKNLTPEISYNQGRQDGRNQKTTATQVREYYNMDYQDGWRHGAMERILNPDRVKQEQS